MQPIQSQVGIEIEGTGVIVARRTGTRADVEIEGLDELLEDPTFAAALADSEARHRLLVDLLAQRKVMRLTQRDVAEHMQTTQSFVSELENGGTDPQLSTLQRYARAVAAQVTVRVELPADCPWYPGGGWARAGSRAYEAAQHVRTVLAARPANLSGRAEAEVWAGTLRSARTRQADGILTVSA